MYRFIANLYPRKIKAHLEGILSASEFQVEPNRFLGFVVAFGVLLSVTISMYLFFFFKIGLIWGLPLFFGLEILLFVVIWFSADKKAKFVDKVLPDALQVMAGDLRAGITTDRAIVAAARPEFGPLTVELKKVGTRISLGTDIISALKGMLVSIRSSRLERAVALITNGLKSGGTLAPLLEQTAEDLRKQDIIDSKIKASVGMYTIFIFIAVAFASPLLFGLSTVLVKVLTAILGGIDIPQSAAATIPISINEVSLKEDWLVYYISVFMVCNSFFGSLILGMISKGKASRGLVFLPVFLALAFGTFLLSKGLLNQLMGGLFTF